jgi:hypothetical protein
VSTLALSGVSPAAARRALDVAADEWGAAFSPQGGGGVLRLPARQGFRRGVLTLDVAFEADGDGSRLALLPAFPEKPLALDRPAFVLLLAALGGALLSVAWPLYPRLLPFVPLGALLAVAGWFLIARQRNRGPEEFLRRVAVHAAQPRAEPPQDREARAEPPHELEPRGEQPHDLEPRDGPPRHHEPRGEQPRHQEPEGM